MSVAREFEAANANYVSTFDKGALPLPPARYVYPLIHRLTPVLITDCTLGI